ncbi:hypothetical protein KDA_74940 [Dictyobacter alpinus]|uniref:Uncharacterized protein n=1 Tax=Dictyobacter alpinus TaxID=2014873 RepID=A0A402BL19_9CHLR|nr:hypothetical protein [Dictyobacter alpinus]GCE32010.1 hypothetical protein KDA_74940 [Dictyobacter alpinus]
MISDLTDTLRAFQVPLNKYEARRFLERVRSAIDYLVVYQHYFPSEYTESMEQISQGLAPLFPLRGEAYSPHEAQLLRLIDTNLFPLSLWYVLDDAGEDNRCYTIPVEPFGIDLSTGDDFLEMDLGWQLMFYLIGEVGEGFFQDLFGDERDAIFTIPIEEGKVDDAALREVCERQREPLAFFRCVIDLVANDTGTVWLDATMEMPCATADWSIETIDELIKQYAEALDMKKKSDHFMKWLEGDLIPNFTEVIRVWNESVILTKQMHQEQKS